MTSLLRPWTWRDKAALAIAAVLTGVLLLIVPATDGHVAIAANTLLTIAMITREALRVLENNLSFTKLINRQFDDKFGVDGAKIGTTLNVRKPAQYTVRTGQALALQDMTETQVPVVLDQQIGVDVAFTSSELALSIDDFSDRVLGPAIAAVANRIDQLGLALYNQVFQAVGTPGTVPSDLLTYLKAGVKLNDSAAPMDGKRSVVISPLMEATIVDALKGLFQQATQIGEQYMKGQMGRSAGFDWYMDQNVASHTVGLQGGAPLTNGAGQTGASIITDGWTATTVVLNKGDVITFGSGATGVYGVNPQSRQSTGQLQQFVVTADVTSDGGGNATIPIDPPITTSGPFQTVVAAPADGVVINVLGATGVTSPTGLAFHEDAFTLACADLPLPRGVDMAARISDKQLGFSIRMIRAYDISLDRYPCRIDVLIGWAALRPSLACRIQS